MEENNYTSERRTKNKKWAISIIGFIVIVAIVFVVVRLNTAQERVSGTQGEPVEDLASKEHVRKQKPKSSLPAKLYLDIDTEQIRIGDDVTASVRVDTFGKNTVVASLQLIWDEELLELKETNTKNSVYRLGAIEDNEPGRYTLTRAIPGDGDPNDTDDGFIGDGIVAELTFTAKQEGTAAVAFSVEKSGVILDDGKGSGMKMEYGNREITIR